MAGDAVPSAINNEFSDLVTFLFMFREGAGDVARGEKDVIRSEDLADLPSCKSTLRSSRIHGSKLGAP